MSSDRLQRLGDKWLQRHETLDSALMVFTILSERETDNKDELYLKAQALNDMGFLYSYHYYDFKEAYRTLRKADDLCETYGFHLLRPLVELNLANLVYNNDRLYEPLETDESLKMYKRAFSHSAESGNHTLTLMIFSNMLNMAFYHDCIDSITDVIGEFRRIDMSDSVPLKQFIVTYLEGILAYEGEDLARAIECARDMRTVVGSGESRNRHLINSYFFESRCEAKKGDTDKALRSCSRAFRLAEEYGEKDAVMLLHRELEYIYRRSGDQRKADLHHYEYLLHKDSILNDCNMGKVRKMKFKDELDRVNDVVKDLEMKDQMRHKAMLWMAAVIALLVLLISALVCSRRMLQKKNTSLYQSYQEILKKEEEQNRLLKAQSGNGERSTAAGEDGEETTGIDEEHQETRKYKDSVLDDEMKNALWDKVLHVMATSPEIYSQNFSASRLAELAGGMQLVHLSQLIGEMTGTNFYNFLCKYRIREACRMMNGDKEQQWTVEGICMQTGFKSRSNFSTNFKRIVGMTPAQYMKEARKNEAVQENE